MNDKLPISLVVITKNEERNLERCLRAADFCAEMVVVDSGSQDRTLDIARAFGARVFHRDWTGYRDQKDFAMAQATQPWVLTIDADEELTPELRSAIAAAFREDPAADAFEINRHAFYAGKRIDHGGWYPQWRLLLFRRGKAVWSEKDPHEVLVFQGRVKGRLAGDLNHYTCAGIREHVTKNLAYATDWARAMHRDERRATVFDLLLRGPWAFTRTYFLQLGFLDGFCGFVIAVVTGFYTFSKYAMLCELNRRQRKSGAIR
jgi:glycosyltransferase involved in cell wall biosynthesis